MSNTGTILDFGNSEYEKIPTDFPKTASIGAVPGNQPKFLASLYQGHFYEMGKTPPEVYSRWVICNDLVDQLVSKAFDSKEGKRSHMSEHEILEQYRTRLLATNWTSTAEAEWVITDVAKRLNWKFKI
ncbi:hypothetical protein HD842_000758 [Massilia aurea]|uniref:Uncharacterized protein n=1 Tax=Massilia aurea TaxID=373040 RepID=A0A7W9WXQ6_9BURK|nr:hypothetical protein [Massilia aurea]MBB6132647.1 hypothetical protein [Massilia aurea]